MAIAISPLYGPTKLLSHIRTVYENSCLPTPLSVYYQNVLLPK